MDKSDKINDFSHIRIVNIEHQSFCNRKCDWCPNKTFSRECKIEISDDIYSSILQQLRNGNFCDTHPYYMFNQTFPLSVKKGCILVFGGYQEPFSNINLFKKRLREAEDVLSKKIFFSAYSNGDYLSKDNLENLHLSSLEIYDFDCKGREYWENQLNIIGILPVSYNKEEDIIIGAHRYIESVIVHLNYPKKEWLTCHGGYFKENDDIVMKKNIVCRSQPCHLSGCSINIAYDGSVMPCPFMRPDNPEHQKYIWGNIKDNSLNDIYYSPKAIDFRNCLQEERGNYPSPCKFCQEGDVFKH